MNIDEFNNLLEHDVVLLDGAMGSNLMLRGMPKGVCTEQWLSGHPQIQLEIQRAYIEAGSQIIYAPTFQANRISLSHYGLSDAVAPLNLALVEKAKEAAAGRAFVAGDISSTGRYMEEYTVLMDVYKEQIEILVQAGVDLLAVETMIGMDETMAAIDAAKSVCDLPVICTMTTEADGSLLLGGNIFDACMAYEEMGAAAVGLNCSLGPDQLVSIVRGIRKRVNIPVVVKPNAGIPYISEKGEAIYSMDADAFGRHMKTLIDAGASIVGGCCGTNASYIKAIKSML